MRRFAIALGVALVVAVTTAGQTVRPATRVLGAGATLCRAWIGADTLTRSADGRVTATGSLSDKDPILVSWVLGYLSATGVKYDASEPGIEAYVIGWISGACIDSPGRTVASVVADFGTSEGFPAKRPLAP